MSGTQEYELTAARWEETTSKPGDPGHPIRKVHRRGEVVQLSESEAQRLADVIRPTEAARARAEQLAREEQQWLADQQAREQQESAEAAAREQAEQRAEAEQAEQPAAQAAKSQPTRNQSGKR